MIKKIVLLLAVARNLSVFSQEIKFEDPKFEKALVRYIHPIIDTDYNQKISQEEAKNFTGELDLKNKNIKNLKGIEYFKKIKHLNCSYNQLSTLDISKNTDLTKLIITNNNLKTLNITKNTALTELDVSNNNLNTLDPTKNTNLTILFTSTNKLTTLDLTKNTALAQLRTHKNQLSTLDLTKNTDLTELHVSSNNLKTLNLTKNTNLIYLSTGYNKLSTLDLTKNTVLTTLYVSGNNLNTLDLTKNTNLTRLNTGSNLLSTLDLTKNTDLTTLDIRSNQLSTLDLTKNTALTILFTRSNKLTTLDLTKNTALTSILTDNNKLTTLDLTKNTALTSIYAENNKLTTLDLTKNTALRELNIRNNSLSSLNLTKNTDLTELALKYNNLKKLDLTKNTDLTELDVSGNNLKTLNLSNCKLRSLKIYHCPELTSLNLIGQELNDNLSVENNPKLKMVCANLDKVNYIESKLRDNNNGHYKVSTDCAKETLKIITGKVSYAPNSSSCGKTNVKPFNGLSLRISNINGDYKKTITPDNLSNYRIFVTKGDYLLGIQKLDNKQYFDYTPKSNNNDPLSNLINITDKAQTITKNFCVFPTGKFDDLAISISGGKARPGRKVTYTITYKNVGTTTLSGSVNLKIKQANKQTLVSASIDPDNLINDNSLTWDFKGLNAQESKTIKVTFLINKPTDSPEVNSGNKLDYTVSITDENEVEKQDTLDDNKATLQQEVKNSWDPNDITCIEGSILRPENVGKYLTYMIRFENKGNANAIDIRVEDVIDPTKFDIKSLRYLSSGNHLCVTEVKDDTVNFNFKNINLGFNKTDNKGYVVYKIKTLPTLKDGDEIKNKASIYFDFNKPVITETETVLIKKKTEKEVKFSDYLVLSPNPVKGPIAKLIEKKKGLKIKYTTINDNEGNFIEFNPGTIREFDLSFLVKNRVYFIMVFTENNGILTGKFIKE